MKKKIISLLLIGVCGCGLLVCCDCKNKDKVNINTKDNTNDNRFVVTGDEYYIGDYADKYRVIYDKKTNIVYLCKCGDGYRGAMSVMYNSQGQPMTLEEYNKINKK